MTIEKFLATYRRELSVVVVYAVFVGAWSLVVPIAIQSLVNSVAFGAMLQPIFVLGAVIFVTLAVTSVLRALQSWVIEMLQRKIMVNVLEHFVKRVPYIKWKVFEAKSPVETMNKFMDVFLVQKGVASLLLDGLEIVLSAGVGIIILAFYHPMLFVFDLLLMGVSLGLILGFWKRGDVTAKLESKKKYEVVFAMQQLAFRMHIYQIGTGPKMAEHMAYTTAQKYLEARKDHYKVVFIQTVGFLALQTVAIVGVMVIGGALVVQNALSLGQLVASELIVSLVVVSMAKAGKHLENIYDVVAGLEKVNSIFELPLHSHVQQHPIKQEGRNSILPAKGFSIEAEKAKILEWRVDERVGPGSSRAYLFSETSQKEAFLNMLLGNAEPEDGVLRLSGVDSRDMDVKAYKSSLAWVCERSVVEGTVYDNIAMDNPAINPSIARVELEALGLFLDLDMPVQLNGLPLKTEEQHLLVFARAMAQQPSLIVIDEMLERLQADVRQKVVERLLRPGRPWMVLVFTRKRSVFDLFPEKKFIEEVVKPS